MPELSSLKQPAIPRLHKKNKVFAMKFIETVKEARRYEREQAEELVIFAGACESYFEALIMAGANFGSSPARILIDLSLK